MNKLTDTTGLTANAARLMLINDIIDRRGPYATMGVVERMLLINDLRYGHGK